MDDERFQLGPPGGPVPSVVSADLKAVWEKHERIVSRHPPGSVATGRGVFEGVCSPGADMRAIGYRCTMLSLLEYFEGDRLAAWKESGQFQEGVFKVAATIPMTWIAEELATSLPFDVDAVFAELRRSSV